MLPDMVSDVLVTPTLHGVLPDADSFYFLREGGLFDDGKLQRMAGVI